MQALRQLRSFSELSGKLFLEDLFSSSFLQSIHLELRILLRSADTGITYDHKRDLF